MLFGVLFGILLAAGPPAWAQVRGISYTFTPVGERIYFDENAGLEPGYLYGGELGFGFGQFVELGALYSFNGNLQTDFSRIQGVSEDVRAQLAGIDRRDLRLRRLGGSLKLNLGTGSLIPFVRLGAGTLRFEPDDLNSSSTIYLSGGAGLQFSQAARYALTLSAENLAYRYNLGATFFSEEDLAAAGLAPVNFNQAQVNNWGVRVGLKLYVGGRAPGEETALDLALREQLSGGLRRLSVPVEPFYASVGFDEALGFRRTQRLAGLFAGLDLGPYVGVRGFYARGVQEDAVFSFEPLQAYGGEVRLNLGYGPALTPYLTFGGGYLDVGEGYTGQEERYPDDQPFLLAGLGARLPLGESVRLVAGVRSLFSSTAGIDNRSSPSDVKSSLMFSAGVSFVLGGGSGRTGAGGGGPSVSGGTLTRAEAEERARAGQREARLAAELARTEARLDSLTAALRRAQQGDSLALARALRLAGAPEADAGLPVDDLERERLLLERARLNRSNLSGQTLTIPIPEEGEIYLRFGAERAGGGDPLVVPAPFAPGAGGFFVPGDGVDTAFAPGASGLSAEQVRQIVRQALREGLAGIDRPDAVDAAMLEVRLREIEDRMERRLLNEVNRLREDLRQASAPLIVDPETGRTREVLPEVAPRRRVEALLPVVGFRGGEGPEKLLVGLRGDYRVVGSRFWLMPEVEVGLGGGAASFGLFGNAAWPFAEGLAAPLRPYGGLGLGFLSESGLSGLGVALNLFVGTEYPLGGNAVFAEFSTLDFFDYNRLLFGYRFRF